MPVLGYGGPSLLQAEKDYVLCSLLSYVFVIICGKQGNTDN
jgi:hypothetical protein